MAEHCGTCAAPLITGDECLASLTREELDFLVRDLEAFGHGHGGKDFEPECPSCTATDKLKAALIDGALAPHNDQQEKA